jgi:integrase
MSVFKRGGIYWFEFWHHGRRYRRSTGVKNCRAAEDIERAFRTALNKGEVGITERKTVPHFRTGMSAFLKWSKQEHDAHPRTHARYAVSSLALVRYFVDTPLDKIHPEDVERFKTTRAGDFKTARGKKGRVLTKKKIRPATVNRELACLKALFSYFIKADVVAKNPVSRVKFLAENNQQTRVLSHVEERAYFEKASPMLRDVARIILETGMRPEEVYTIRPENVDLERRTIQIPHGKTKAARRLLTLTSAALEVLRRRIADLKSPYVFPCETDSHRPIPKVNNAHDRAVKDSKIAPLRLYDLRHTWATRAAMSGIDLVTLAAMLGHSRIQMVLRYAHPTHAHQAKAMEQLEQFNAAQQIAAFEKQQPAMTQ